MDSRRSVTSEHARDLAAIGAKGVNANSATEYPTLLSHWGHGEANSTSLKSADDPRTRAITDFAARTFANFDDVDSTKVLTGSRNLTINTPWNP